MHLCEALLAAAEVSGDPRSGRARGRDRPHVHRRTRSPRRLAAARALRRRASSRFTTTTATASTTRSGPTARRSATRWSGRGSSSAARRRPATVAGLLAAGGGRGTVRPGGTRRLGPASTAGSGTRSTGTGAPSTPTTTGGRSPRASRPAPRCSSTPAGPSTRSGTAGFWEFAAEHLIDDARGGWYPQLTAENARTEHPWYGKPDVYHVMQAFLAPLLPGGAVAGGGGAAGAGGGLSPHVPLRRRRMRLPPRSEPEVVRKRRPSSQNRPHRNAVRSGSARTDHERLRDEPSLLDRGGRRGPSRSGPRTQPPVEAV